jgi:hypothetical protein
LTAPRRPWWQDRDDCEDAPPRVLDVVGLARVPESSQDVDPALAFSGAACENSATPEPWQARTSLPTEGGEMSARSTPDGAEQGATSGTDPQVYRPLPESFRAKGWDFRQIDRIGDVALFEKTHTEVACPSYEVVIVQRHGARVIAGREIPAAEAMPSTEMWGRAGWTLTTENTAREKFTALVAARAGGGQ